jgi:cold shock protein
MLSGKIQSVRPEKGFGFIRPDDRSTDVFFHRSSLQGDFTALREGQPVTYELDERADRPRATRVLTRDDRGAPRGRRPDFGARRDARPDRKEHRERPERRERPASRERTVVPRPKDADCQRGFVTKLHYDETHGFISADKGGTEIRFEPAAVVGDKRYADLKIGDYVEFAVRPETADTKCPEAFYVREIERTHHFPQTQLSRHPKARRKKPTWR